MLDEADNDPAGFLAYLVAALQQTEDEVGQATLAVLGPSRGQPVHLVIATRADPPLPVARLRARGQLTSEDSARGSRLLCMMQPCEREEPAADPPFAPWRMVQLQRSALFNGSCDRRPCPLPGSKA